MKRARYLLLILLGSGIILSLIAFQSNMHALFSKRELLFNTLYELKSIDQKIEYEILETSFYLYHNYDRLDRLLRTQNQKLQSFAAILPSNPKLQEALHHYQEAIQTRRSVIQRFQYLNSSIKNSTTYILKLIPNLSTLNDPVAKKRALKITSKILLAKSALDPLFLQNLKPKLERFFSSSSNIERLFAAHVSIFLKYFPSYVKTIDRITSKTPSRLLENIEGLLQKEFKKKVENIHYIFMGIIIFYLVALGIIFLFMLRLDRENRLLERLRQDLAKQAITDEVTKLRNRRAFKQDRKSIQKPFFALIDINGFKHYNDFYGVAMGDHILRQSAAIIEKSVDPNLAPLLYRLGGDEFGVLIDEKEPIDTKTFAKRIEDAFKNTPIIYKGVETTLSVSIAITRKRPLLELADLVMKLIKKHRDLFFLEYSDSLHLLDHIKSNIQKSKTLRKAIEGNEIVPYFQGIYDIKTNKLRKYEVLARIEHNDRVESIFPYLPIAKELGLYKEITRQIFTKAFAIANDAHIPISLNLSMQDVENEAFWDLLRDLLNTYPSTKLSLEILESEMIADYTKIKELIDKIHDFGGEVGIDDFGSGYSNFMYLFNLDIDFIKIDGSLVKELPTSETAYLVVKNIVSIAKELRIEIVAEFVSSKEIFESIKELEIDLAQGFFLHKPEPFQDRQANLDRR